MRILSQREKPILAGLYLSKFDSGGLRSLGFESFVEAFNVIGSALGIRPASIKNYRDEFDPLFPNGRKGWHKRPTRDYCKAVYDTFHSLNLEDFTNLLKRIIYKDHDLGALMEEVAKKQGDDRSFAKRLITGQAAEQYYGQRKSKLVSGVHSTARAGSRLFDCAHNSVRETSEVQYLIESLSPSDDVKRRRRVNRPRRKRQDGAVVARLLELKSKARRALAGDSNDSEHDALYEVKKGLGGLAAGSPSSLLALVPGLD